MEVVIPRRLARADVKRAAEDRPSRADDASPREERRARAGSAERIPWVPAPRREFDGAGDRSASALPATFDSPERSPGAGSRGPIVKPRPPADGGEAGPTDGAGSCARGGTVGGDPSPRTPTRSTVEMGAVGSSSALPRLRPNPISTDWAIFGPLVPAVTRPGVTDVFVNGTDGLFVDTGDGAKREAGWHADERTVRALAVRLIGLGGRHVDEAAPCMDVRLYGGIRVHVVLPPISTSGTLLSIRIPRQSRLRLADLVAGGSLTSGQAEILRELVRTRANILISGAAGSGKTTLLTALLAESAPGDRIVALEDVAELQVPHPHFISLETRQANLEGAGGIGLDRLVREALRMRPDRLVVGECRGPEIRELLTALNTGHDGGAGTVHANSLEDVPARLEALAAGCGMSPESLARQAVSAVDVVLHVEHRQRRRRLAGLGRLGIDASGRLEIRAVE